jgi:hypothetical protein
MQMYEQCKVHHILPCVLIKYLIFKVNRNDIAIKISNNKKNKVIIKLKRKQVLLRLT